MDVTFVGTWTPRRCGIATFTHDLLSAVRSADPSVRARVLPIHEPGVTRLYGAEVVARIRQGDADSYREAAHLANGSDVVNVQHEFGLYGVYRNGRWEDHLVPFLDRLVALGKRQGDDWDYVEWTDQGHGSVDIAAKTERMRLSPTGWSARCPEPAQCAAAVSSTPVSCSLMTFWAMCAGVSSYARNFEVNVPRPPVIDRRSVA